MNDDMADPSGKPLVSLTADLAGCTDIGHQRDHQEDAFFLPAPPFQPEDYQRGLLLIVADGVGGLEGGDEASRTAVAITQDVFTRNWTPDVGYTLQQAITAANATVYQGGQVYGSRGRATTIVCAVLRGDQLYVAHVGDSRLYRLRDGALELLTQDHSWVQMQVRLEVLTEEEARIHPKRHIVTRSLGMEPTVEIEMQRYPLRHGDRVMLCSDGLYDMVPEDDIAAALVRPPRDACAALIRLANEAGGSDNITVIVAVASLSEGRAGELPPPDDEATADHDVVNMTIDEDQTAERRILTIE